MFIPYNYIFYLLLRSINCLFWSIFQNFLIILKYLYLCHNDQLCYGFTFLFLNDFYRNTASAASIAAQTRSHHWSKASSRIWHSLWLIIYPAASRIPSAMEVVHTKSGTSLLIFVLSKITVFALSPRSCPSMSYCLPHIPKSLDGTWRGFRFFPNADAKVP